MESTIGQGVCNATALRKASRRLTQLYDDALEPAGLRATQYAILHELVRRAEKAPTMNDLASVMVMDRSSLGHNLRPLLRDGYVALATNEADRRQRLIRITELGKSKVRECKALWQKAQDRFHQVFGESDAVALRATLLRIAHDERLAPLRE